MNRYRNINEIDPKSIKNIFLPSPNELRYLLSNLMVVGFCLFSFFYVDMQNVSLQFLQITVVCAVLCENPNQFHITDVKIFLVLSEPVSRCFLLYLCREI